MAGRSGEIYQNNDFQLLNNPFYLSCIFSLLNKATESIISAGEFLFMYTPSEQLWNGIRDNAI